MNTLAKSEDLKLSNGLMPSFSNLVENFFGKDFDGLFDNAFKGAKLPAVNISQTNSDYNVEVAAPGMKKEDFNVEIDGDLLTISSTSENEHEKKTKKYTRREYSFSSFSRSFVLPKGVKEDKIEAAYKNGVLKINIPKDESSTKALKAKKVLVS